MTEMKLKPFVKNKKNTHVAQIIEMLFNVQVQTGHGQHSTIQLRKAYR